MLYGSPFRGTVPGVRRLLERAGADYEYWDITRYADTRTRVRAINGGLASVPTLEFPDGTTRTEPKPQDLETKVADLGFHVPAPSWRERLTGLPGD